jgi:hypothetical protein
MAAWRISLPRSRPPRRCVWSWRQGICGHVSSRRRSSGGVVARDFCFPFFAPHVLDSAPDPVEEARGFVQEFLEQFAYLGVGLEVRGWRFQCLVSLVRWRRPVPGLELHMESPRSMFHKDKCFAGSGALHRLTKPLDSDGVPPVLGVKVAGLLPSRWAHCGVDKGR